MIYRTIYKHNKNILTESLYQFTPISAPSGTVVVTLDLGGMLTVVIGCLWTHQTNMNVL